MSIPFAAGGGGAESRWIRIEQQARAPEGEGVTLAEAAAIIDSLFQIDPCEQGMGGGGEPANEENEPAEEEVAAETAAMLGRAGLCVEAEYWDAVVHVYRSHQSPSYVLRSETAEVIGAGPVRGSRRESVEMEGRVIHLTWPYAGNLQGLPAGVTFEVRGSSIILSRPLRGELTLRYDTLYDRVTLRIPTDSGGAHYDPVVRAALEYAPGDPFAVAGRRTASSRGHTNRRELPSASVVAFWGDLAASCELEPPEQDDSAGADEIAEICGEGGGGGGGEGGGDDEPKDCWKTVHHYSRCNCSRDVVDEWTEMVAASCDDDSGNAGDEEKFDGYVTCEGEEDAELQDPEYYKAQCCEYPSGTLPRCRRTYAIYNGGAEIDGGPERWKNIYGENVAMVAVLPKSGICGDKVTEWKVKRKNCCEDVEEPMTLTPEEATIAPGTQVTVYAVDFLGEVHWSAGQLRLLTPQGFSSATFKAPDSFCGTDVIVATDDCSTATMTVLSTRGRWKEVFDFDPCSSPWGGPVAGGASGPWVIERRGIRVRGSVNSSGAQGFGEIGCPHKGGCQEAWERTNRNHSLSPCDYSGTEIVLGWNGGHIFQCEPSETMHCFGMCSNSYVTGMIWGGTTCDELANTWTAEVHHVLQVWRWECE